ncbi:kinase-like domain-containing protein [Camillea tinctor]|nr:kinase-like domain-containing protein [Camillea tinctor]
MPRLERSVRFETVQVLRQATDALEYLHGLEITHRDISTSNILVCSRGPDSIFIKFAGFGLSKEGQQFTTICGNEIYLAPELSGSWRSSSRLNGYTSDVDIWSAGVVVTELPTLRPPRSRPSQLRLAREYLRLCQGPSNHQDDRLPASVTERHYAYQIASTPRKPGPSVSASAGTRLTAEPTLRANEEPGFPRSQNTDDSPSNLDDASLEKYIRKRSGAPLPEGTLTRKKNKTQVRRLADKMQDPEHRLFTGSVVDGLGENFDIRDGSSIISDTASQPDPSSPSGPATSPGTAIWKPDASCSSTSAEAGLPSLKDLMQERELLDTPIDTAELSRIWDAE